jgi:VCBS repeat-containing protein
MKLVLAHWAGSLARRSPFIHRATVTALIFGTLVFNVYAQIQPLVAIHDSELTRFLDSSNAPAIGSTPIGTNTTGLQWWISDWQYFVMPESLKEAMRSDGTAFAVVGDSNITAGVLLTNGLPKYPILISLATEAIRDDEIAPLTNYVAAGGFLLVGSSAFTRTTNGTTRGDFAFANEMGIHMSVPGLTNWILNNTFTKQFDHRTISHIPGGQLTWRIPTKSEEISWGISPSHSYQGPHDLWRVSAPGSIVLATGDSFPYVTIKQYGKGWFIYCAQLQPLVGHGGFAPGMYAYVFFRKAIEWAYEASNLPIPKISPWPYPFDAAFMVRHDLENFTNEIAAVAASAQVEFTNGARGDYYFCTGTLREDAPAAQTNAIISGLRQAVTNFGATIAPHNGGLRNPYNFSLNRGDYDWWHWGLDEVLDVTPTNYPNGKAYAQASLSNAFADVETWLAGITNGIRAWVGCYFNSTREDSYSVQAQLGVQIAGDQKLTPFPHWTLSTRTPGLRYSFLTEPVSDWYIGGLVAQSVEPWHPPAVHNTRTLHDAIDFFYNLGALINIYSHTLSTGLGDGGQLAVEYLNYGVNTNLHPRLWTTANAVNVYQWWLARSNAQITATYSTNGPQSIATFSISGCTDPNSSVELVIPGSGSAYNVQVFTNAVLAGPSVYRANNQGFKIRVGTTVTNAQIRYVLGPKAQNDNYLMRVGTGLNVAAPGVLGNDLFGIATNLTAVLVAGPTNGSLQLNPNGGFAYTPSPDYAGADSFSYQAVDALGNSSTAAVSIVVSPTDILFADDFTRTTNSTLIPPWLIQSGNWSITNGVLQAGTNVLNTYGFAYITNSFTNCAVQAQIEFPAGAFGGGLGGRLDPPTGKRYVAWIYPEGSAGGSNVLKLLKFQSWTTFTVLQQTNLASVGTNWHAVKMGFQGNRIGVYFDTNLLMSVTDGSAPYPNGGISLDMSTTQTPYLMSVDDVVVSPLVAEDNYTINEDTPLSVAAPGMLANDTGVFSTNLTAVLVNSPTHGILNLNSDGSFNYQPSTNYNGDDSFTYQASDGQTNLGTAVVTITINPVNDAPVLPPQSNRTISELANLIVTNKAADVDLPPNNLTYSLLNPPAGAAIDGNGVITWTPSVTQGPSTNTVTTVVTDDGVPPLSATNSFLVYVRDINSLPILPLQTNRSVNELTLLVVTNTATENNILPLNLQYQLVNPPFDAKIDASGIIRWTPSEDAGPGSYSITTMVTDTDSSLTATNTFLLTVNEVNTAPVLPFLNNVIISGGTTFSIFNGATDSDKPANTFTYQLLASPNNASIDANGLIVWTPASDQVPSTNLFKTKVTDFNPFAVNAQHLSATNSFTVTVLPPGVPPIIEAIIVDNGTATITWSAVSGHTYRLQFRDDLDAPNWSDVLPDIIATGSSASATNAVGPLSARFYRVFQVQ